MEGQRRSRGGNRTAGRPREPDGPIDYHAVFRALPGAVALLTPDLRYADVNDSFTVTTGRSRGYLLGRHVFDVFPDRPEDPRATGARSLRASLERVLATGQRDSMPLQRYDLPDPERPGQWEERYWSPVNSALLSPDGRVELIVHRVEEVTELVRSRLSDTADDRSAAREAELYTRARELQELNDHLRRAHAREREIALSLQRAMLPPHRQRGRHEVAVRYRPASTALNVCGDWYELVDLPGGRLAVAVGDVVGHGLPAAGVMGQLRSALSAASRVAAGPGDALEILGLYARGVEGAECTTAVEVFIDWEGHTLTYSSAGHLPPVLLHADGRAEFLDGATDPPLGARPEHSTRPQADLAFDEGSTLVLYTDGLVERRGEGIDEGLHRLADCLSGHRPGSTTAESLADLLLAKLVPDGAADDDTALVVIRL
ncbi:PP2C family protein-serine/threonine phosphatase [Streptomyces sp. CRN 30]|uniref:PP2C family protein-serine/threonine phosphatase n=1 Tax=Streptomyces sp. CRN 30 TaxID=3075613 RepID=UPI002A7FE19E|nr:SpoIIE family protein phosphatase [Streptomyces sp. CRN 30]